MTTPITGVREYEGAIKAFLRLKQDILWLELGQPTTNWADDAAPPTPTEGATDVETPYLYVRTDLVTLCRLATNDTEYQATDPDLRITIGGVEYIFITDANAYTQATRWLLVRASVDVTAGMPAGTYRQVRLLTGLQPATGHECESWLLPAHVTSPGLREWTENVSAVTTSSAATTAQYLLLSAQ